MGILAKESPEARITNCGRGETRKTIRCKLETILDGKGDKMKGDQAIQLTRNESRLAEAMGIHMEDDDCCGTLVYTCWVWDGDSIFKVYQFVCKKCYGVIQVYEKTNQSRQI